MTVKISTLDVPLMFWTVTGKEPPVVRRLAGIVDVRLVALTKVVASVLPPKITWASLVKFCPVIETAVLFAPA